MASASSTTVLAVALSLTPWVASAAPTLSGSWRAEPLGRVELATNGDRLTGVTAGENACKFEGRKPVLEGTFEGNVLVGTLTLCQTGPGCAAEQPYAVFAIYNPTSGALTAHVRLAPGCQSPALKGGRLVLVPGSAAEKSLAGGEGAAGPAPSVARKHGSAEETSDAVNQMLKEGNAALLAGNYAEAQRSFEAVLSLRENNLVATLGKGTALLMRNETREAIRWLEKARAINKDHPNTAYVLACAYGRDGRKPKGLDSLRRAVRLGYPVTAELYAKDKDLQNLLGSEDALQELLQQARGRKQGAARERQEPSDP